MDYKTITYEKGPVARVIPNRPQKLNAQTKQDAKARSEVAYFLLY